MTLLHSLIEWLSRTTVSQTFNEAHYLWFGAFMAVHLIGIALLVGASLLVDLRVLDLGIRAASVTRVAQALRPWLVTGLAVTVLTGTWLFVADPLKYYVNPAFRIKVLLLLLAGLAQCVVQHRPVKPLALLAVLLWLATAVSGRAVGLL
ncbi:DUF6644 family protein [Pseudoxanthomonas winnipegensis]|uniref:DUF2214 domain-containing protein n=1 Tax=Pseudoxanthomonas winnipegensis TaxID=2480810 RepID=A0A4Q8M214_9GAMM|nr:DUF6644 family protein [Pseudoxanthomonas winnipegensis]RZZ86764.1 DUF2214 domain-containing protein [Pseudoxanthomonas winnipegensis]TAA38064.1 DUF2214 domain-containing protein [Pseudoxanthomonas winnipegensis]